MDPSSESPVSSEAIAQLLQSADYGDRLGALNQVRRLPSEQALPLLLQAAADSNARVRYAAVSQVASTGHVDPARSLTLLRDRLLNDSEADVQAAAADAIGALQLTEAYDDLAAHYHRTTEWLVKFSIVAVLGELQEPRAFELLTEAVTSPIELVQTAAITALGELGDTRAVSLLIPFAVHDDWQVRLRVAQALNRFRAVPETGPVLAKLAQDTAAPVAQAATDLASDAGL